MADTEHYRVCGLLATVTVSNTDCTVDLGPVLGPASYESCLPICEQSLLSPSCPFELTKQCETRDEKCAGCAYSAYPLGNITPIYAITRWNTTMQRRQKQSCMQSQNSIVQAAYETPKKCSSVDIRRVRRRSSVPSGCLKKYPSFLEDATPTSPSAVVAHQSA